MKILYCNVIDPVPGSLKHLLVHGLSDLWMFVICYQKGGLWQCKLFCK